MTDRTVLCVDTEGEIEETESAVASEPSLSTIETTSVTEAQSILTDDDIDAVVTEYELADGTGMEVVETIREESPQTPCVLFTDARPDDIDTSSFEDLIVEYLGKHLPDAHDRLGFVVDDVIVHSSQVGFLLPDNEQERLAALGEYDIEDLPIEESFERLTDLIASHFDTAVAFIGLLEKDEEDFVACHGADWDSLTREHTICTHSMLQDDVMVVEDISDDKRFRSNDVLHNLGIVSYAGANMTTRSGEVIGQVCLIDHEPRSYDAEERADLQRFADEAMEMLELRQRVLDADVEVAQ
jgi:GAF domain-containing protein